MSFDFHAQGSFDELGEVLSLTAYRSIQAGLTNIYKHANASHVQISGGTSAIDSAPGRGLRFEAHLPITQESP